MANFVALGNGVVVNTFSVSRVIPDTGGTGQVTVHFTDGSTMELTTDDATTLKRHLGLTTAATSNLKTLIFWIVIMSAVLLAWLAVRLK
jgi:hypothetical protein